MQWLNEHLTDKSLLSRRSIDEAFAHYGCLCPQELTELYRCFPGGFVENGQRDNVLFFTPDQLVDTVPALIDIDIAAVGFIPLADLKDNDFLVYRPMKRQYSVYNIVDETEYGETGKLEKILRDLLTFD